MNISHHWLLSIAPTVEGDAKSLADQLGMLGAPVDELVELGRDLGDIVIGRVTDVRAHPNADRLRLCTVEAGGSPLQVVCGAPNVEVGAYYPFAPVGARLPGDVQIRKAKLRGEVSEGMLCSARELGLGRDHTGILPLPGDWEPGAPFVDALGLNDSRLVLDVTPNRPDLLSHLGVARELAPGGVRDIRLERFSSSLPTQTTVRGERVAEAAGIRVEIEDVAGCPRYMAAVIEGVKVAPSPAWLAMRLRAIGVRPINNVVDATNYVLHELGQPLHAFDLDRLAGPEIHVRPAREGESLRTLDGIERPLSQGELVIADRDSPAALAGVMGGEASEVTDETTRILLECARFDPLRIRRTARSLGLSTDASHRFERGVDTEIQPLALERVADLILHIAGGSLVQPVLDVETAPVGRIRLRVRPERVRKVLGLELTVDEIATCLEPIGFGIRPGDGALEIEVPPYRPDVTREVDVIEEIARRRGYERFDADLSFFRPGRVPPDSLLPVERKLHELFGRWGFLEARTAAFAPAAESRVPLLNPLSAEESHLRDDLTTGLLRRVEHNWARGARSIRLYEIGTVFHPDGSATPGEEVRLSAVLTGPRTPPHWSTPAEPVDLWDLKGLLDEVAAALGGSIGRGNNRMLSSLDPRTTLVIADPSGQCIGAAGQVLSNSVDAPAWADPLWAIEALVRPTKSEPVSYRPLPEFPPIERDLALLVPEDLPAERVEDVLRSRSGELLDILWPFDLYAGSGVPEGKRSIAWRFRFRHPERTLTDAEVDAVMERVVTGVAEELSVERR